MFEIIKENIRYPIIALSVIGALWGVSKIFHVERLIKLSGGGFSVEFYTDTLLNSEFTSLNQKVHELEILMTDSSNPLSVKGPEAKYNALTKSQSIRFDHFNDVNIKKVERLILDKTGFCFLGNFNRATKQWDSFSIDINPKLEPKDFKVGEVYLTSKNLVLNSKLPTINHADYDIPFGVIPSHSSVELVEDPIYETVDGIDYYWIKVKYIK